MQDITEIKKLRKVLNLTQKELANRANVSQSLIAKIEAGQIDPTYTKVQNIFNTLNLINKKEEIPISKIVNRNIISISPNATIFEAIALMKKHEISQLPVISDHAVGLVSESILLEYIMNQENRDIKRLSVQDVMTECPPILSPECPLEVVTSLLKHYPMVLIKDKEKLTGLIAKADILSVLSKRD